MTTDAIQTDATRHTPVFHLKDDWQEEKQTLLQQIQDYQQQVSKLQNTHASEKKLFESETQGLIQTLEETRQELQVTTTELQQLQDERKSLRQLSGVAWRLCKQRVGNRVQKVKRRFSSSSQTSGSDKQDKEDGEARE